MFRVKGNSMTARSRIRLRPLPLACLAMALACLAGSITWAQGREKTPPKPAAVEDRIAVFFSPNGGVADALIAMIGQARKSIAVQAYVFTHNKISEALIEAHERGVAVDVILDDDQSDIGGAERMKLRRAGITVYIPKIDGMKMHNKTLIIDSRTIVTGSFNFTYAADEKNAENLIVIEDRPRLVRAFEKYHEQLQRVSKKYETER